MDAKATGGLIARRRKKQNWSQGDLAERLHVTDKAVSRWETGRGLPSVDLLEPLAEALGLTVSELLSGRELTAEELPKAAGEQIMESMRKGRKLLWRGAAATLAAVALAGALYVGYHYATSVFGRSIAEVDREGLEQQAVSYMSGFQELSSSDFDYSALGIVDLKQRGDYLAALCVDGNGHWEICIYERDRVFPDRWRPCGERCHRDGGLGPAPGHRRLFLRERRHHLHMLNRDGRGVPGPVHHSGQRRPRIHGPGAAGRNRRPPAL